MPTGTLGSVTLFGNRGGEHNMGSAYCHRVSGRPFGAGLEMYVCDETGQSTEAVSLVLGRRHFSSRRAAIFIC